MSVGHEHERRRVVRVGLARIGRVDEDDVHAPSDLERGVPDGLHDDVAAGSRYRVCLRVGLRLRARRGRRKQNENKERFSSQRVASRLLKSAVRR